MENNYLIRKKLRLLRWGRLFAGFAVFGILMLVAASSLMAQTVCSPKIEFTVQAIDESSEGVGDAKLILSGVPEDTYYVGYSSGATYTGSALGAGDEYSTKTTSIDPLTVGRYVATGLINPTTSAGDQYTVRVQSPTDNCYTDSTVVLPRVNWSVAPPYTDLEVRVTKGGDASTVGDVVKVTIEVYNNNTNPGVTADTAKGVVIMVHNPLSGFTYVANSDSLGAGQSYDQTSQWFVGDVLPGQTFTMTLSYISVGRGVFQVGAEVQTNTATVEELDSVPLDQGGGGTFEDEDDEGSICIQTPWDWCETDRFVFKLLSNQGGGSISWYKDNNLISGTTSEYIATNDSLVILSPGTYNFSKSFGGDPLCDVAGCCPITVYEGVKPDLAAITPQAICFGDNMPTIVAIDNKIHPDDYEDDRGPAEYQWFNNNGTNNPNSDSLSGYTSLSFDMSLLPDTAGTYLYRLIARDSKHITCLDTTDFQFVITNIEKPIANSNSPICAEDSIILSIDNPEKFVSGFNFNWYYQPDSSVRTGVDSTVTFVNADSSWSGDYIVMVSQTFNLGFGNTYCEKRDTVNVIVNPLPLPPVVRDTAYCQYDIVAGLVVHIVDSTGGVYLNWYGDDSTGSSYLTSDPALAAARPDSSEAQNHGPFYVTQTDINGCESHMADFDIVIHALPEPPSVEDIAYCEGDSPDSLTATTTATTGYVLNWYGQDSTGVSTGTNSPTPDASTVDTLYFYVTQTELTTTLNCESFNSEIIVYIKDTPDRPSFVDPTYCLDDTPAALTTHLTQSAASTTSPTSMEVHWQYPDTGFTDDGSAVPSVSTANAGSYYGLVWEEWNYLRPDGTTPMTCTGEEEDFRVIVNPKPEVDIIAVNALCVGDSSLNNGSLYITDYRDTDTIDWQVNTAFDSGASYTSVDGSVAEADGGRFAKDLSNPPTSGSPVTYAIRVTNEFGCQDLFTEDMTPKDCECPGGYCEPASVQRLL